MKTGNNYWVYIRIGPDILSLIILHLLTQKINSYWQQSWGMERQVRENNASQKDQYKRFLYRSRRPASGIRTHVPGGIHCTGAEPEGKIPYRGFFCVYSEELENAHAAILRSNDLTCISEAPVPHAHFGHAQECRALEGREFEPNVMKFEARLRKFHHIMNGEDSLQEEFIDHLVAIHDEGNHTFPLEVA